MNHPLFLGADPFILCYEGKYYIYPTTQSGDEMQKNDFYLTGEEKDGIMVYVSENLTDWECKGYALTNKDVMGDKWFWAPEVTYKDGKFYMAYSAEEHMAVAVANHPLGPFKQEKKCWLSEEKGIDGHIFIDEDGQVYFYYVRFDNGNKIMVAKMSEDFLSIDESTETFLIEAEKPWETIDCLVTEGPFVLKHKGMYYLTYSANHTRCQDYAVGYAIADSPWGPFKKYEGNPILHKKGDIVGVGHHSFARLEDGRILCSYHCHCSKDEFLPRKVCLDWARFEENPEGGYDILVIDGPTSV